jgi:hypothetical protein
VGADRGLVARYEQLADLAEAEAAAAIGGDLGRLEELVAMREELRATLPASAPAEARPALQRALAAQQAADHALQAGLGEVRLGLTRLQNGRTQLRGYAPAAGHIVDASS